MSSVKEESDCEASEPEKVEETVSEETSESIEEAKEVGEADEDLTPAAEVEKWKDVAARSHLEH